MKLPTENQRNFLQRVEQAAARFKEYEPQEVILFHHNDADGLSSGIIIRRALERLAIPFRPYCLEKPYPDVVRGIIDGVSVDKRQLCIFADFGSGMLTQIHDIVRDRFPVIVLDHHTLSGEEHSEISVVNPLLESISGSSECSASTVCYLFAVALNQHFDDLLPYALLGAFGDRHLPAVTTDESLNALCLKRAIDSESAREEDGRWTLRVGEHVEISELVKAVNALGSFGYLKGGPDVALKGLTEGFDSRYIGKAREYIETFEAEFEEFLIDLELNLSEDLVWFDLSGKFEEYGVKTVGLICEELMDRMVVKGEKYILGFQPVPSYVPGAGSFELDQLKISMRLTPELERRVRKGERPGLDTVLPNATRAVGGFVDACHLQAAATTISPAKQLEFLQKLREEISVVPTGG